MKKKILMFAAVVLLGGCGANEAQKDENQNKETVAPEKQEKKEEIKNQETEEVVKPDEQPADESTNPDPPPTKSEYKMRDDFSIQAISNPNEKIVLLTIDDAPDKNALAMAKVLKDLNVKAIFFVNGHFIDTPEEGEVLKQIHQMGFPIGNHTYNHKSLKDLTEEQQRVEIVGLNDRIEELIGERPRFFRAPFGMNTEYSKKIAAEEKMLLMNWTYGYDWEKAYQSKEAIADIMVNTPLLRNGANLLMHDREWTSAALGDIVKGLQNKGYKIVDPDLIETPDNKETAAQ
ncbi:polysaccharide deacetylase family protein [Bacillus sp. JJ1122]|uniref:polysaccharide deacetylase family protein n=1 Tax=Bacillus sp. JJ1122 TaxID=3122951 RepID=UPI002FFFF0C9